MAGTDATAPADERLSVLTAAANDQITGTLEAEGHGLFTFYMLKGLQGEADKDKDGHVTLAELHDYLQGSVRRAARRQNREQEPQLRSSRGSALRLY